MELRDRFSDLWEERRLLVILVAVILVALICLCGAVGLTFIGGGGAPAPVAIETPTEEGTVERAETPAEEETPGLPTATEETPLPQISPTATHVLREETPTLKPETPIAEEAASPTPMETPTEEIPIAMGTPTEEQTPITGAAVEVEEETPITETEVPTETPVPQMTAPAPEMGTPQITVEAELETPPTEPPGGETPVTTPMGTPGKEARVLIAQIYNNPALEYVLLINEGEAAQDLSGWRIQADHAWQDFYFPQDTVIQPGMTIKVNSGPEAIDQPPTDLLWTSDLIWNDEGDTARLYNATNNLSTQYTYAY